MRSGIALLGVRKIPGFRTASLWKGVSCGSFFEKVPVRTARRSAVFSRWAVFVVPITSTPRSDPAHPWAARLLVVGDYIGRFAPGNLFSLSSGLPHMLCNDRRPSDTSEPTHIRWRSSNARTGDAFGRCRSRKGRTAAGAVGARHLFDEGSATAAADHEPVGKLTARVVIWSLMELLEEMVSVGEMPTLASVGYATGPESP